MDDQTTYQNLEELISDLAFIEWARTGGTDPQHWVKTSQNRFSEEDISIARKLVRSIGFQETAPTASKKKEIWAKIESQTQQEQPDNVISIGIASSLWRKLSIAASLAILITAGVFLFSGNEVNHSTSVAEQTTISLPDHSTVELNAESAISYSDNWETERSLELTGEAFFQVEKGEKFTVHTPLGSVAVLGTSFNVYSRDELFKVECHTGKVMVKGAHGEVILKPGESADLIEGVLQKTPFSIDQDKTWMKGYHLFESKPFLQVVEELERQFGIDIITEQINENASYTGFFLDNDLQTALQSVCWPLRYEFKIDGDKVRIFNGVK